MKKAIWIIVIVIGAMITGAGYGIGIRAAYNQGYNKATEEAEAWVASRYQDWEDEQKAETDELLYNIEGYVNGKIERDGATVVDLNNDDKVVWFEENYGWTPEE